MRRDKRSSPSWKSRSARAPSALGPIELGAADAQVGQHRVHRRLGLKIGEVGGHDPHPIAEGLQALGGGGAGGGVLVEADYLQLGVIRQQQGAVATAAKGGVDQPRRAGQPRGQGGEHRPHRIGQNREMVEGLHGSFLGGERAGRRGCSQSQRIHARSRSWDGAYPAAVFATQPRSHTSVRYAQLDRNADE
jgi:hypothetical protein